MKTIQLILKVLILSGSLINGLHAQEIITATGGNGSGSGGSFSYSAGQIVYTAVQGVNGSVLQGIQQPYEISILNSLDDAIDNVPLISVYPNPAADHLILDTESSETQQLRYHLYDLEGSLLKSAKITGVRTIISMGDLRPSTYLLKIIQIAGDDPYPSGREDPGHYNEVKTFKIIKN